MADYYGPGFGPPEESEYLGPGYGPGGAKKPSAYAATKTTTAAPGYPVGQPFNYRDPYFDPDAAYNAWDAQETWRTWASQNKTILNEVWKRWEGYELDDNQLMILAQGGPEAEPLYATYEKIRKYERFRPAFWNLYGMDPNKEQIERAIKRFGLPERMEDEVMLHRQIQATALSRFGRKATTLEIQQLKEGKVPKLPKIQIGGA